MSNCNVYFVSFQSAQVSLALLEQTSFFDVLKNPRKLSSNDTNHLPKLDDVISDATLLQQASQHMGFNLKPQDTDLTLHSMDGAKRLVEKLLLRHTCQLVCNAHAITEIQRSQVSNVFL